MSRFALHRPKFGQKRFRRAVKGARGFYREGGVPNEGSWTTEESLEGATSKANKVLLVSMAVIIAAISLLVILHFTGKKGSAVPSFTLPTSASNSSGSESPSASPSGNQQGTATRYDDGVSTSPSVFTKPDGTSLTGAYNKSYYNISVAMSTAIAKKYSSPFKFYYQVAPDYYTSSDLNGKIFFSKISGDSTYDNLYDYLYSNSNSFQEWADDALMGVDVVDILKPVNGAPIDANVIPSKVSETQAAAPTDIVILANGSKDWKKAAEYFAKNAKGTAAKSYAHPWHLTFVEVSSYPDTSTVTYENYKSTVSGIKETHVFTVNANGTVK